MENGFGKPIQNKIILVDVEYEVVNGFIGLNRDLVMKLVKQMKCTKKTCNIIGIAKILYEWSKQKIFLWAIYEVNLAVSLRPNKRGRCVVRDAPTGPYCSFTAEDKVRTVFVNNPVAKGVCRWTVRIAYDKKNYSYFAVGAAPPDLLSLCDDRLLGYVKGTSAFVFWKSEDGSLASELWGVENQSAIPREETPVPDASLVSIEADCAQRTLSFFLNDTKVPRVVSKVHVPLFFGMSGCTWGTESSFASVSFRRLFSATLSAVACTMHRLKK